MPTLESFINNKSPKQPKAYALYSELLKLGKTIEGSKKRISWRFCFPDGAEHEVSLTHSLTSGKKVIRLDGAQVHESQSILLSDWDYTFHADGNHLLHCMIRPSLDLDDMYDLIIDGVSYCRLPEKKSSSNAGTSISATKQQVKKFYREDSPRPDLNVAPWECPQCTLLNDKPFARVCAACEGPKPTHEELMAIQNSRETAASEQWRSSSENIPTAKIVDPDPFVTQNSNESAEMAMPVFDPFGTTSEVTQENTITNFHSSTQSDIFDNSFQMAHLDVESKKPSTNFSNDFNWLSAGLSEVNFSNPVKASNVIQTQQKMQKENEASPPTVFNERNGNDLWSPRFVNLDLKNEAPKNALSPKVCGPSLDECKRNAYPGGIDPNVKSNLIGAAPSNYQKTQPMPGLNMAYGNNMTPSPLASPSPLSSPMNGIPVYSYQSQQYYPSMQMPMPLQYQSMQGPPVPLMRPPPAGAPQQPNRNNLSSNPFGDFS